jgi:carbamate kinase
MGYMMGLLSSELKTRGIDRLVTALVTQVVVDKNDPDFQSPSKYVGPTYSKEEALDRKEKDGWAVKLYKKDASGKELWRRVVPSPVPTDIVEIEAIEALIKAGIIPVTVGGGGVPVSLVSPKTEGSNDVYEVNYGIRFKKPKGKPEKIYSGVEAVIDKDLASALLGNMLLKRAQARGEDYEVTLTIFTGEDGAKLNYQKPDQVDLRKLTLKEAEEIYDRKPCPFPAGSMGPKIKAAIKFIQDGGHAAYISKTELFDKTLAGTAGTTITR